MKTNLLGVIVCAALASLGMSQAKATSLVGPTTAAAGIDGLVVGTETYDVSFVHNSLNQIFLPGPIPYIYTGAAAQAAAAALITALDTYGVTALFGDTSTAHIRHLYIPFFWEYSSPPSVGSWGIQTTYPTVDWHNDTQPPPYDPNSPISYILTTTFPTYSDFAVFNPSIPVPPPPVSSTPIPKSLPLFATGLVALGCLGWRRKRKANALAA